MGSKLVKNLILFDPHRIKCTAESIPVKFHIPVGCQLITIYIPQNEYDEMVQNADNIQTMSLNQDNLNGNNITKNAPNTNGSNVYPPMQFKKKNIKREKSIVFTNIPEEQSEVAEVPTQSKPNSGTKHDDSSLKLTLQPATVRPNHLPLRFKNITSREIPESGFSSSITFDEQDSFPQFIGHTSVCSTPMTENKVLHGNILPICGNGGNPFSEKSDVRSTPNSLNNKPETLLDEQNTKDSQNKCEGKFLDLSDRFINNTINKPFTQEVRRNSLVDITSAFRKFSKHLSLHPISNGFANFIERDYITDGKICAKSINYDDPAIDCEADEIDDVIRDNRYRTITDPTYPVFSSCGKPISCFLFEEIMNQRNDGETNANNCKVKHIVTFDEQFQAIHNDLSSVDKDKQVFIEKAQAPTPNNIKRGSLSLPLKSLTNNNSEIKGSSAINSAVGTSNTANTKCIFDRPDERGKLTGIQLTPLITKLSILAMSEDRSNTFSSWDTTPAIDTSTPLFRRKSIVKAEEKDQIQDSTVSGTQGGLKEVELFICGQNNMTMLVLMKENFGHKNDHIQAMVS